MNPIQTARYTSVVLYSALQCKVDAMYIVQQAKYSGLIFSVVTVHCLIYKFAKCNYGWPGNLGALQHVFCIVQYSVLQYAMFNLHCSMYKV